jgi:hypothetical protein
MLKIIPEIKDIICDRCGGKVAHATTDGDGDAHFKISRSRPWVYLNEDIDLCLSCDELFLKWMTLK